MNLLFTVGNIIETNVDGLVCSGNIQLNMSGGVNGALLQSGGEEMQIELHKYLADNKLNFVEPSFVIRIGPQPFHFRSIIYSVAIDGFYESTINLVEKTLAKALDLLSEDNCKTIAIPSIATGYGNLSKFDFGKALKQCLNNRNWTFTEIIIVSRDSQDQSEIRNGYEDL